MIILDTNVISEPLKLAGKAIGEADGYVRQNCYICQASCRTITVTVHRRHVGAQHPALRCGHASGMESGLVRLLAASGSSDFRSKYSSTLTRRFSSASGAAAWSFDGRPMKTSINSAPSLSPPI